MTDGLLLTVGALAALGVVLFVHSRAKAPEEITTTECEPDWEALRERALAKHHEEMEAAAAEVVAAELPVDLELPPAEVVEALPQQLLGKEAFLAKVKAHDAKHAAKKKPAKKPAKKAKRS